METFSGWIREIVSLLIFVVFLELLIPRSSMERLIRVVVGLLILVTILKPVVLWIHDFHPMEMTLGDNVKTAAVTELDPMRFLQAAYEQGLAHKIKAYLLEKGYGESDVAVVMSADNEGVTVRSVDVSVSAADRSAVQADICKTFDLASDVVTVRQGGR